MLQHRGRQGGRRQKKTAVSISIPYQKGENKLKEDLLEKRRKIAAKLTPAVVELPSHSFRCQISVNGKRKSFTDPDPVVAHANAVAWKLGLIEKKDLQKRASDGKVTLGEAIEEYIDARNNVASPSTIRGYYVIKRNYFQGIMDENVHDIDEFVLQRAINEEAKTRSQKTIKNGMGLILSVLSRYKTINTRLLKYPQKIKKEHAYLDAEQIVRLISACEGDIAEIPILMGVWLGLRRSEIMGLHWDAIDLENKKVKIERSMVIDPEGNTVIKDTMKTESSNRTLDLPAYIASKLEASTPPSKRKGQVFKIHYNTIYKNLEKICEKADIPFVGVHGLRHTNASVMLSLGIIDKVAMARGGWSSKETMERIYQHIFTDDKQSADDAVNDYFNTLIADKLHTNQD